MTIDTVQGQQPCYQQKWTKLMTLSFASCSAADGGGNRGSLPRAPNVRGPSGLVKISSSVTFQSKGLVSLYIFE